MFDSLPHLGAGGNIGVSAGAGGVLLIDSQFSQLHEKVKAAIADVGGGSVRFILNTNGHYDPIGNGGSVNGMIAAAGRILGLCDEKTKIIPGHGRLSDPKRLQDFRAMLETVRDRVAAMIRDGKTLEAVVASKPTGSFDKD